MRSPSLWAPGSFWGRSPAQANSWHTYWIATSYHGNNRPSDEAAQRETRSEANRRCQAAYGFFKARGVTAWGLGRYDNTWEQNWRCDSN